MNLRELKDLYRERYQRQVHFFLFSLIILVWIGRSTGIQLFLNDDFNILLTFTALVFVLNDVAENTYSIFKTKFFAQQDELYNYLTHILCNEKIREATLIQYTGFKADTLLNSLINSGANVKIYLHDQSLSINDFQRERLINFEKSTLNVFTNEERQRLQIIHYNVPASFRAVLVDNKILAVGWYTYVINQDADLADEIRIRGHNTPGILCYKGSPEFDCFIKEFNIVKDGFCKHIPS